MIVLYAIHGVAILCVLNLVVCMLAGDQLSDKGKRGRMISLFILLAYIAWQLGGQPLPVAT